MAAKNQLQRMINTTTIASNYQQQDQQQQQQDSSSTSLPIITHPLQYNELQEIKYYTFGYKTLTTKRNLFLCYIFLIFLYIGINLGLLGANFKSQDFIEENYFMGIHAIEFWGVFIFTAIEGLVLISTNNLQTIWQMGLILFNITFAFITALLFQLHPPSYEIVAHYMEYSCQITITLVNFLFIWSQLRPKKGNNNNNNNNNHKQIQTFINDNKIINNSDDIETQTTKLLLSSSPSSQQSNYQYSNNNDNNDNNNNPQQFFYKYRFIEFTIAGIVFIASIFQLLIFSEVINTGLDSAERAAHFLEFSIEAANGLFASFFAIITFNYYNLKLHQHADHIIQYNGMNGHIDAEMYY